MVRDLQFCGVLLLALGLTLQGAPRKPNDQPPPPNKAAKPAPRPTPPANGGQPKPAPIPKGAARLVNPGNVITRLYSMTPDQRDRVIEKMLPEQQERVRKNLEWFDGLPKEQQQMQLRRIERFEQLTPERKVEVAELVKAASKLPSQRQNAVRQALYRLQQMTDRERENTLARPQFQARFSADELKIISGLADAWMGPQ